MLCVSLSVYGNVQSPRHGHGISILPQWNYGTFDSDDPDSVWEASMLMQKLGLENYSIEAILSFCTCVKRKVF